MNIELSGLVTVNAFVTFAMTVPLSLIILALYKRALRTSVLSASASDIAEAAPMTLAVPPSSDPGGLQPKLGLRETKLRLFVIYAIAALTAGATVTLFYEVFELGLRFNFVVDLLLTYAAAWPFVPSTATVLGSTRRGTALVAASYLIAGLLCFVLTVVFMISHGRAPVVAINNARTFQFLTFKQALVPGLITAVLQHRRIRAASTGVFAALLVFGFATMAVLEAMPLVGGTSLMDTASRAQDLSYVPWFLLISLPVGALCWVLARGLVKSFRAKRFSEVQLSADSWWLLSILASATMLITKAGWKALWTLAAFAVYRLTVALGLALWPIASATARGSTLLFLRVFRENSHAELLYDQVAKHWRFRGSVYMLGGPDLAVPTADVSEILALVSGTLRSNYIHSRGELAERLRAIDDARDPDGRFRSNKLLCRDDTWQPAFEALLARADVVLMDLREFSNTNRGCMFELQKIVESDKFARTLLVHDASITKAALREQLIAGGLPPDAVERMTTVCLPRNNRRDIAKLRGAIHGLVRAA